MICKFIQEKKESWDSFLDTLTFAYNTSCHRSTLNTPFEVMFGRKAILPIDHTAPTAELLKKLEEDDSVEHEKATEILISHRSNMLQKVKANIIEAQKTQKKHYDLKHAHPKRFQVGARVWKKDFRRKKQKGGKMDPKWLGPYKIIQDLGKGLYKLQLLENPDRASKWSSSKIIQK